MRFNFYIFFKKYSQNPQSEYLCIKMLFKGKLWTNFSQNLIILFILFVIQFWKIKNNLYSIYYEDVKKIFKSIFGA